jgi:hypothetical protein
MDRDTGPMGLKKQFAYDEVLRAIGQQPLDLEAPKRVGLKTYEDIFFSNLINDQTSYQGDTKKGGFSHETPYEPPAQSDVFYDARSDDESPLPPGGGFGPPPPPPPGGYGVFEPLFGNRVGNRPIQSGYYQPPEQPSVQIQPPPNAQYNFLSEEGQNPEPEPGLLQQMGQNLADSARTGAINRAGELGAAAGGAAVGLGGQALQRVGGAIRDGAVRAFDWENGMLWRAADEMGNAMLNPLSWRQTTDLGALRAPLLEGAGEAVAGLGAAEMGALEGAELGAFGGPAGMLAGAALGGAASAGITALAFRDRDSSERQDHFLDARSLNNGNESVRPLRPRFSSALDQRERNPQALRPRLWRHDEASPAYYRLDAQDGDMPTDYAPGRAQEPLRPTAAQAPMQPRLTAQGVIDRIATSQPAGPEELRQQRRAARNRLPPGQTDTPSAGSYQDVMRATAAPTVAPTGLNAAPSLPPPRRRNRGRPAE